MVRCCVGRRSCSTPDDPPAEAALSPSDWARFRHALIAANFWALDPVDEPLQGLDGAEWLIEGAAATLSGRLALEPAGRAPCARPAVLRSGRAAAIGSQAVLKQPDREGSNQATLLGSVKSLGVRAEPTAGVQIGGPRKTGPTDDTYPDRRRSLFPCRPEIRVERIGRFAAEPATRRARSRPTKCCSGAAPRPCRTPPMARRGAGLAISASRPFVSRSGLRNGVQGYSGDTRSRLRRVVISVSD